MVQYAPAGLTGTHFSEYRSRRRKKCKPQGSHGEADRKEIEEIKKKIRDLKLKQKMTTGRLEWNDIQREIDILNNELKQLETDKPQYGK